MDIFEAFALRCSYRGGFKESPIPRGDLRKIVQAGINAPSGKNAQTTEFVIVDERPLLEQIQALHPTNKAMQQAQAYIACLLDKVPEKIYEGYEFQVEDCAAAVENILLAICGLGYASVWIDGWLRLDARAEKIGQLLNIPQEKIVRVILPIGIPEEEIKQKAKKPFEERAWFNRYGSS